MRTRTSEPGEQDLGQERGTNTVPRLIFVPESASPGSRLPENLRAQCPCRRVLYVWLMAAGLWERALTNPWVDLTQGRALELMPLFLPYQLESGEQHQSATGYAELLVGQ